MPFVEVTKAVLAKEDKEFTEIISQNPKVLEAYEQFEAECKLRKELAVARKNKNNTHNEIQEKTRLTQQVISRMEKDYEISSSLKNLIKYVNAIGYELKLTPKENRK